MEILKPEDILSVEEIKPEDILSVQEPKSTLESLGESASDLARGIVSGLTFGGLEELTAAGKAAISDEKEDFSALYKRYLEAEEEKEGAARERSPYLTGAGEFAGSILPGFLTGGATLAASGGRAAAQLGGRELLKAAGKGLATGAATGALGGAISGGLSSTEGGLIGATEEEKEQLLEDIKSGAKFGGVFGGAFGAGAPLLGAAVKKGKEALKTTLLGQQTERAYEKGLAGKGYITEPEVTARVSELGSDVNKLKTQFKDFEAAAAREFKDPLEAASELGESVQLNYGIDPETGMSEQAKTFFENGQRTIANQINEAIEFGISPNDAYDLRKRIKKIGEQDPKLLDVSRELIKDLDNNIEDVIQSPNVQKYLDENGLPKSYKEGLKTYSKGLEATIESVTEKGKPVDARRRFFHDIPAEDATLFENIDNLVERLSLPGSTAHDAIRTVESQEGGIRALLTKLAKEKPEEMERVAKRLGYDSAEDLKNKLIKNVKDVSVDASVLRVTGGERPIEPGAPTPPTSLTTALARKPIVSTANVMGQAVGAVRKAAPYKAIKSVYNLPEQGLLKLSQKLSESPGLEKLAKNLQDAIQAGDTIKKNAMLFAIAQRPDARNTINEFIGISEED